MQTTKIYIERSSSGWVDRARVYDVMIDNELRGTLRRGSQIEIDVEPGEHLVYLKIDWCRSRTLVVELNDGEIAPLRCLPGNPLTVLYRITLGRNKYMRLEPVQS